MSRGMLVVAGCVIALVLLYMACEQSDIDGAQSSDESAEEGIPAYSDSVPEDGVVAVLTDATTTEGLQAVFEDVRGDRVDGDTWEVRISCASVPELPKRLYETNTPNYCLFRGELEPDVAYAAPYVAILVPNSPFADWVFSESPGKHWGIFAHCRYSIKEMRRHCRALVNVYDEKGTPLIFRYYDPRVLRDFYQVATPRQRDEILAGLVDVTLESAEGRPLRLAPRVGTVADAPSSSSPSSSSPVEQ